VCDGSDDEEEEEGEEEEVEEEEVEEEGAITIKEPDEEGRSGLGE